tara:strand:+ start:395 stop:763 length:369 start_codon:yes stop_codon:yes gene_type:complete
MSWKDSIKKEKFQGPKRQGADFIPDKFGLTLNFKSINRRLDLTKGVIEDFMKEVKVGEPLKENEMNDLQMALSYIDLAKETIDELDEQFMESAKYSERRDSDDVYLYGAKFRNPDGSSLKVD